MLFMKKVNEKGTKLFNEGMEVFKKAIPVAIGAPLMEETIVSTLEGEVIAPVGFHIVTGVKGEKYPIGPEVFAQYEEVSLGLYAKQKIIVRTVQLEEACEVDTPWGATLQAKKGDFLIMETPENMWVVEEKIFGDTYAYNN